jgi:hypothetical protein
MFRVAECAKQSLSPYIIVKRQFQYIMNKQQQFVSRFHHCPSKIGECVKTERYEGKTYYLCLPKGGDFLVGEI